MKIIIEGEPKELSDFYEAFNAKGTGGFPPVSDSDEELEKKIEKDIEDTVGPILNYVHYSETKKEFLKISDIHPFHMINIMKNLLQNSTPQTLFKDVSFQSLVMNLNSHVVESILKERLDKDSSGGSCFDDSLKNN